MRSRLQLAIEQFDLEAYIEERVGEVLSSTDGGNQIRTYCPFCPSYDADRKGKFYANIEKRMVYCQRCEYGRGVDLVRFIMDVDGASRSEAIQQILGSVSRSYGDMDDLIERLTAPPKPEVTPYSEARAVSLPPKSAKLFAGSKRIQVRCAENYLLSRGLTRRQSKRHEFYLGGVKPYYQRLIVPVYFGSALVHWVARDLSGSAVAKYLAAPDSDQSLWLFNWDRVRERKRVVVVEGVFDALSVERARLPGVASFGKRVSDTQALLLSRFDDVIVFYDDDALTYAYEAAERIGPKTRVVWIPRGDPGGSSTETIRRLVKNAPVHGSPDGIAQLVRATT